MLVAKLCSQAFHNVYVSFLLDNLLKNLLVTEMFFFNDKFVDLKIM